MKVLHLIDSSGLYGAEKMLLTLMDLHRQCGLEPVLGSMGKRDEGQKHIERKAMDMGLKVKTFRFRSGLNIIGGVKILNYANSEGVNLLHSHGYKANILLGAIPSRVRKIPMLCTLHGWTGTNAMTRIALYTWLECRILRRLDAVVAVSSHMRTDARLLSAGIEDGRLHVIYNGIEEASGERQASHDPGILRFMEGGRKLVAVGRLSREKNFTCLLEAISMLRNRHKDIKLVIFGEGSLRNELQESIKSMGLEGNIYLAGYHDDVRSYLPYFNVLVISSITEGLPVNMLEAMAAGLPVVATAVGGIPEVITDHENGLLAPVSDPVCLSLAVDKILTDQELADRIKVRAEALIREKFSSRHMAERYRVLYETVTGMAMEA